MKADNILAVIEKLGEIIIHNRNDISYLEYENKKLKAQVEKIEQYISYYTEADISDIDYKDAINNANDVSYSQ